MLEASLRYCFGPLVQIDLNLTRSEWNRHPIRNQKGSGHVIPGVPNYLYYVPEKSGTINCGYPVSQEHIDRARLFYATKPIYCDPGFTALANELYPGEVPTILRDARQLYDRMVAEISLGSSSH